jgi:adenosylmethionine-8-amino-7-oxononanoate aminotransferase
VAALIHAAGLRNSISFIPSSGVVDGKIGDIIIISPAYNITAEDVELIVERTETVVREVLG